MPKPKHAQGIGLFFRLKWMAWAVRSLFQEGASLMALLHLAAHYQSGRGMAIGGERRSYSEVRRSAKALAAFLAPMSLKGAWVGLALPNSFALLESLFALNKNGANVVLLDPDSPAQQLQAQKESLQLDLLVTEEAQPSKGLTGQSAFLKGGFAEPSHRKTNASGRLVLLTSGSTGKPKAASRSTKPLVYWQVMWDILKRLPLLQTRHTLIVLPLFHGYGLAAVFLQLLFSKNCSLKGKESLSVCQERLESFDALVSVPYVLQRFGLECLAALPKLKHLVCGGDALPPSLAKALLTKGKKVYNLYGSTEAGLLCMAGPKDLRENPGTLGKPVWGVRLRIEQKAGKPCLLAKCTWSAMGKSWWDTGDLAQRDEQGRIVLLGRADDMLIHKGENICPHEVSQVLLPMAGVLSICLRLETSGQAPKLAAEVGVEKGVAQEALRQKLSQKAEAQLPPGKRPQVWNFVEQAPTAKRLGMD